MLASSKWKTLRLSDDLLSMRKILLLPIFLLVVSIFFGFIYLPKIEITKVSLKCSEKFLLFSGTPTEETYLKLTRLLFDDEPYKLYSSNPDLELDNSPPYLIGISDKTPEGSEFNFNRIHVRPDWYIFVPAKDTVKRQLPTVSTVTYINRETLKLESTFSGDKTNISIGQCEIIQNDEFEKKWKSKVRENSAKKKI